MKTILSVILIFSSGIVFSQKVISEEIQAQGESLLIEKLGENTLKKSCKLDSDSYNSYLTKSGKPKSRFLKEKQLDKGLFNYAQLVYNIDIEYLKCPEYSLLSSHIIIHVDSSYRAKTVEISDDLNLPMFCWKNDSCSVLDSNIVRGMVDSIGFKKGRREIFINLRYNFNSKQLEWILDNLLWQQLEPRSSQKEIVVLEARTGKFIKRYEYQYPIGFGM